MTTEEMNGPQVPIDPPQPGCVEGSSGPGAAPRSPPPPWRMGAARAWLIFASYLGVQLAIGLAVGVAVSVAYFARHGLGRHSALPVDVNRSIVIAGGVGGMVGAALVAYWLARRAARREPGLFRAIGWSGATPRVRTFAVLWGVALGIAFLTLFAIFPPPKDFHPGAILDALNAGGWVVALWVLVAIAIAPPVEEFVFRGVMWTGLSRSWGGGAAGAVVTVVFVALHFPETRTYVPAIAAITGLGLSTLAIRRLSRSLVPSVLLHASYNGVMVLSFFAGLAAR